MSYFLIEDSGTEAGMTFWAKPGVAGWRLKPARKGSVRPGWGGVKKKEPTSVAGGSSYAGPALGY